MQGRRSLSRRLRWARILLGIEDTECSADGEPPSWGRSAGPDEAGECDGGGRNGVTGADEEISESSDNGGDGDIERYGGGEDLTSEF